MLKKAEFTNVSLENVGFSSCWKPEPSMATSGAQTEDSVFTETGSQSIDTESKVTQTDNAQVELNVEVDEDKLAAFLKRVCPLVLAELDNIHETYAFDGYELIDDSEKVIKKLHTLKMMDMSSQAELMVSGVTWNSTGSVVALAYSHKTHNTDTWCDHMGSVHLFNIDRRDFSPTSPSKVLETTSCVSCISAHPKQPSILAAGTFLGEVLVWDLQKDQDYLLGSSKLIQGSHQDAVSQLSWVHSDNAHDHPTLVSAGSDGRILMWHVRFTPESFTLQEQFIITTSNALTGTGKLRSPLGVNGSELGVVCFSFTHQDPTAFIVGIEGGGLLRCSTASSKPVEVSSHVMLKDPIRSSYKKHEGSVSDVQCGPQHTNIFLSCGSDNEIRVYNTDQFNPVKVIPTMTRVLGLQWWPMESHVFAAWGTSGFVDFYSIQTGESIPAMRLMESDKLRPLSSMGFNQHRAELLAVGDTQAKAVIWHIPGLLRDEK